jgi:tight adherence protein B
MTPPIFALLAIVGVGAAGFALLPAFVGASRAEKRRRAFQGDMQANRRENAAAAVRENRRRSIQQTLKQQTDALNRKRKLTLQDMIFQAGLKTSKRDFIRNQIIVGAVVAIVVFVLQVPPLYSFIFGVAAGYLLPRLYLGRKRKKYQALYLDELPNAVEAIVRGVKSGLPLNDSMRLVAKEAKEPIKSEFQRVLDQQAVGKSMTEAVQVLLERVPLSEVNFFVVVISVQQQAGGNLSEALGNLSRVLRNRKKMKQKIKAMSSEAKASAGIIGSLPFIVGLLVTLTTPSYMVPMFTTTLGFIWLGIAAILMTFGVWIMAKMVSFDF